LLPFVCTAAFAQIPEDALRYSFYPQNGSARVLAIGGAMGSLGGDITTAYVNPAGLGNYRSSEFVVTPGLSFNNNSIDFRGTNNQSNKNAFGLGPSGFVFGYGDGEKANTSHAISITVMQTANFNNSVQYSGYNNYSSYAEKWAEEAGESGETIDQIKADPQYAFSSALALYTHLVDTFRIAPTTVRFRSTSEFVLDNGDALFQQNSIQSKGGIYEIALGYATNKNDKLLIGATLGIPILHYENSTTFTESDTSANTNNNFGYFKYNQTYTTSGVGINLKAGVIYKPTQFIRLGFAIHTPTIYSNLKDTWTSSLEAQTENYHGFSSITSNDFTAGQPGESQYNLYTPLKMMISGSYVFREAEDVSKQRAFVTGDIEYVNHHGSIFTSSAEEPTQSDLDYYHSLNDVIKSQYKGAFNFRVGGELKFNTIMGRLGFAYYGNPYKDPALKASNTLLSGGVGYRNNGIFVDLTYVYSINKNIDFPYRLEDKANTFATTKNQLSNVVMTFGIKL